MTDSIIQHPTLGTLELHVNARARRFIFRPGESGLKVTMPLRASKKDLLRSIEELMPQLQKMLQRQQIKQKGHFIDTNFSIRTVDFEMRVLEGVVERPSARLANGVLEFVCPKGTCYRNERLQLWFVKIAEEALRHLAKRTLPSRLDAFAKRYGFRYNEVKIHKSHGRWGSCNTRGNINLSLYLMLLPRHLQDYVILHELCHTVEMNHSTLFWKKLDSVTEGRARPLRDEMKQYDTSVFFKRCSVS